MVRRLLPRLDLAQLHPRVRGGGAQHALEILRAHEVAAGGRREIAPARKQLHRAVVDLAVAALGSFHGLSGFGEGRRVENDEVIGLAALRLQRREQVEDVRAEKVHALLQAVARGVFPRHPDRALGYVRRRHVRGGALHGVERKGTRVREAVQHALAPREPRDCLAVVFLVEEEAGLLPVLHVHGVENAVLADLRHGRERVLLSPPALALFKALKGADGGVVALVDPLDPFSVCAQDLEQQGKEPVLDPLDPDRERLRGENVGKAVDRQTGKAVGLPEDDAAAGKVLRPHHAFAVVPGVLDAPPPEGLVKAFVGVAGEQAQPDLALAADETGAEIFAFFAHRVGKCAVLRRALLGDDLLGVDPGMAALDPARPLGGDDKLRKSPFCFHMTS